MDMNQMVVKSEQGDEILLFYVDETGVEQSIVTCVDNVVVPHVVEEEVTADVVETPTYEIVSNISQQELIQKLNQQKERWPSHETERLLTFYIDNKATFVKELTPRKQLWAVACKNIFVSKTVQSCETKLNELKKKYIQLCSCNDTKTRYSWRYYNLCNQAFHDYNENNTVLVETQTAEGGHYDKIIITKGMGKKLKTVVDKQVVKMLELYIDHKKRWPNVSKELWQKNVWDGITKELGVETPEYWHKRFLNFKQNYIRLVDKKRETGIDNTTWPYFKYFNEIFMDDENFQAKFVTKNEPVVNIIENIKLVTAPTKTVNVTPTENEWDISEMTILAKYCFDSFQDFNDKTIPNKFLWMEVGRLLNKNPNFCEFKYNEIKKLHLEAIIQKPYVLNSRVPLAIILDNIIAKEVALELEEQDIKEELWTTEEIDDMVKYLFEHMEMLNDPICYNVSWACVANKVKRPLVSCKRVWDSLVALYVSILNDKKENPCMEIDWRYIELFDRICDYGTNVEIINGHKTKDTSDPKPQKKKAKYEIKHESKINNEDDISDEDPAVTIKRCGDGDEKAFKILEFYQKNKDLFNSSNRLKSASWAQVAKEVNMSPTQCAHRFRNLKQVYMTYLTRECKSPDKPIVWPYYPLCKKVFGYRALKTKIQKKTASEFNFKEWNTREIKKLIEYLNSNLATFNMEYNNLDFWTVLSNQIVKDEEICRDKFLELRKSYRKLKTMLTRNPNTKISWKYYSALDNIFGNVVDNSQINVDCINEGNYEMMAVDDDIKQEIQDSEDIQCIIVIPEGQDIEDILMNETNVTYSTIETENVETEDIETIIYDESNVMEVDPNTYVNNEFNISVVQENIDLNTDPQVNNESYISDVTLNVDPNLHVNNELNNFEVLEMVTIDPNLVNNETAEPITTTWSNSAKTQLLQNYLNYLESHKEEIIDSAAMWNEIASRIPNKTAISCKKIFLKLKRRRLEIDNLEEVKEKIPNYELLDKILSMKTEFVKDTANNGGKDVDLEDNKVQEILEYYLKNLEEFLSPKYDKKTVWTELANKVNEPMKKVSNKVFFLKKTYINNHNKVNEEIPFKSILKDIMDKQRKLKKKMNLEKQSDHTEYSEAENKWKDNDVEQLLIWYLINLEKFKNPKFLRTFLWKQASEILGKSPLACSDKMAEMRTEYRSKVRENPEELKGWRFFDLCQKIYGTGKKSNVTNEFDSISVDMPTL